MFPNTKTTASRANFFQRSPRVIKRVIAIGPTGSIQSKDAKSISTPTLSKITTKTSIPSSTPDFPNNKKDSIHVAFSPNEIWIEGDNPSYSIDSRHYGPIQQNQIEGKLLWRVWPLSKWGKVE